MSQRPPDPSSASGSSTSHPTAKPPKRRRWWRWLLALLILIVLFVAFLPNLAALPMFRGRLLDAAFSRWNAKATVGDLSLGWFTPVSIGDFKLQPGETDRAALSIDRIDGNTALWRLLAGGNLGSFRLTQPELFVEFDREGSNLGRLLRGVGGSTWGNRAGQFEIVDGRLLLKGPNSPQPWRIDGVNLSVAMTPAGENAAGVASLRGSKSRLLNEVELTPEMSNDIFKFVVPPLAQTTRTSGRVSLELDSFDWPLGKPQSAQLKGRLTLHSVDVGPGELMKSLASLVQLTNLPATVQIAKDDAVAFEMRDGRVHHENLVFQLAGLQATSRGSVGFDETLDWYVELNFSGLEGLDLANRQSRNALAQQRPTVHFTGTLTQPTWKLEGSLPGTLNSLRELMRQRRDGRGDQPRPGVLPGQRPK